MNLMVETKDGFYQIQMLSVDKRKQKEGGSVMIIWAGIVSFKSLLDHSKLMKEFR